MKKEELGPPITGDEPTADAASVRGPANLLFGDEPTAEAGDVALDRTVAPGGMERTQAGSIPDMAPVEPSELPLVRPDTYEILRELGRGGMGRVLVARDRRLRREVALKELHADKKDLATRFVREALVTARLQHPGIVPVHEAGRWPSGEPFYAMKLVAGQPLSKLIESAPDLAARLHLLRNVAAVADAVSYAHSQHVIHRDLKPENVVVGDFGETIVLDWGLAKELDEEARTRTATGSVLGTPAFMSPEQAAGLPIDERGDVYALGAMIYNVLSGRMPYSGSSSGRVVAAVLAGPPPPIAELAPDAPADLIAIVSKAMARQPKDRYPSARELAGDLERFLDGGLVGAHRYSTWSLLQRWLSRHRLPVAVAAVALLVLAAGGAFSVRRVMVERDTAERERRQALREHARAESARAQEAARVDELTLAQARLGLERDPTETVAWLKRLREGTPSFDAGRDLAVRAHALGVARRVLFGHGDHVVDVAYSRDGRRLASAGRAGEIWVWEADAGRKVGDVGREARRVGFSADGTLVLAAAGGLVALPLTGAAAPRFTGEVDDFVVSPDGATIALIGGGALRVADAASGAERAAFPLGETLGCLAASADGRLLAAGGDATVLLVEDGAPRRLAAPRPTSLSFSPDGGLLAAGGAAAALVFDLRRGGPPRRLEHPGGVELVVFAGPAAIATAGREGTTLLWPLAGGAPRILAHRSNDASARDLRLTPDGATLLVTRGDAVRAIDVDTGVYGKLRSVGFDVGRIAVSPDGRSVAVVGGAPTIRVFEPAAGQEQIGLAGPAAEAVAATAQPPHIAVVRGGRLWLDGRDTGCALGAPARAVALTADGAQAALLGDAGVVICEGAAARIVTFPAAPTAIVFGPGAGLTAGLADGRVVTAEGAELIRAPAAVETLAFSADGSTLVARTGDTLVGRRLPDGPIQVRALAGAGVLALSPDGRTVVAGCGESVCRVDLFSSEARLLAEGTRPLALAVAGGKLAVAGDDHILILLDLDSGEERPIPGYRQATVAVALSADGTRLGAATSAGVLRTWPVGLVGDAAAYRAFLEAISDAELGPDDKLDGR